MDPLSLAAIAAPFVAKGADVFSTTAGEKLGGMVGDLCKAVVDKFKGDSYAEQTLARAQEKPEAEGRQNVLKEVLAEKLEADPDFAEKVQNLMDELEKGGTGAVFDQKGQTLFGSQTNIAGDIHGSVNIGDAKGYSRLKSYRVLIDFKGEGHAYTRGDLVDARTAMKWLNFRLLLGQGWIEEYWLDDD
ncbi:MAG: hypothetical protein WB392_11080 [Methanotrichaceae archaeon]